MNKKLYGWPNANSEIGNVSAELFEYIPETHNVTCQPGQKMLDLTIVEKWQDWPLEKRKEYIRENGIHPTRDLGLGCIIQIPNINDYFVLLDYINTNSPQKLIQLNNDEDIRNLKDQCRIAYKNQIKKEDRKEYYSDAEKYKRNLRDDQRKNINFYLVVLGSVIAAISFIITVAVTYG